MFNRRFLRVKILQGLYAFYQNGGGDAAKSLKELNHSIERAFDLYLHLLSFPLELKHQIELKLEDGQKKSKEAHSTLTKNVKFLSNQVLLQLDRDADFQKLLKKRAISWVDQRESMSRFFKILRNWKGYEQYLEDEDSTYKDDLGILLDIYKELLPDFDHFGQTFLEKSIYWDEEDFNYALFLVVNTVKKLGPKKNLSSLISPTFFSEEDKDFVNVLFSKTISNNDQIEKDIMSKTMNWDSDRIAMIDMILMKMAISEIVNFKMIPVKVSMNEYIDISKAFSSPKSGQFINGILDKVVLDLKERKKFKKSGRGLME